MQERNAEGSSLEVQVAVAAASASLLGLLNKLQAGENPLAVLKRIGNVSAAYRKVLQAIEPVQVGLDGGSGGIGFESDEEGDEMSMSANPFRSSRSSRRAAGVATEVGGLVFNPLGALGADSPIAATMVETMITSLSMIVRVQMREKLLGRLMEAREGKHEDLVQMLEAELRLVDGMPTMPSLMGDALAPTPDRVPTSPSAAAAG